MLKDEAVLSVSQLFKKYSKSLRRSLWYGVRDIASELSWWSRGSMEPELRQSEFWALHDINFDLHPGESLAIIGTNGAGKSTLLKTLYGLIKPDYGEVRVNGRVGALIELGTGFNPILSGRENIYINASILGFSRRQIDELMEQIEDFAEIHKFMDTPVQYYSSGMTARLSYAIAAHLKPDVLLVDEVLAVGDLAFQRKCIRHMQNYLDQGGTLIFVSHSPHHIQSICQRGILLEQGQLTYSGTSVEALNCFYEAQHKKEGEHTGEMPVRPVAPDENNPVIIESLRAEPLQGETIYSREAVRLRLTYQSLERYDVMWGFSILTGDQWVCVTGNFNTASSSLKKGRGELSCVIPRLPLVAGSYWMRASIAELATLQPLALLGWQDAPEALRVHDHPSLTSNARNILNQLVVLDVEWT